MAITNNATIHTREFGLFLGKLWRLSLRKFTKKPGPENIWSNVWKKAAQETAEYVEQHMLQVPYFRSRKQLFKLALSRVTIEGLYLEFGCGWQAKSINFLAKRIPATVHGFDSFEGLPEAWFGNVGKHSFSAHGKLPTVRENVELHAGWFDQTLPHFAATHEGLVAFMHIDCDIYCSTKVVFDILGDRIVPGTVIQFDEYFNYPGWQNHEYKAFQEFLHQRQLKYEYLGYCQSGFSVAVRIM